MRSPTGKADPEVADAHDAPAAAEADRRWHILDTAARLIAERGYHAVRVADVAHEVGVSSGAVHYHFDGKDDLLTAALIHAVDRAFDRQSVVLREIDDGHERLLALIDLQLPRLGEVRDEWAVWMQFWAAATFRPELRAIQQGYYDRWADTVRRIIARGQRQGVFRADADPETVAQRLTAMTDGLAIQYLTGSTTVTVTGMREILVRFAHEQLLPR